MKGINIDESNKLIINPMQIDANKYEVVAAKTQAPSTQSFTYVEPVEFGTGCFGNPNAFNRLQEILHQKAEVSGQSIESENSINFDDELSGVMPTLTANSLGLEGNDLSPEAKIETGNPFTLSTQQDNDGGAEPAFC